MRKRIALLVVSFIVLWGCGEEEQPRQITMRYNELGHLAPVLRPGDRIVWQGATAKWDFQSPCETSTETPAACKISSNAHGRIYTYDCDDSHPCDPEIMVDDSRDKEGL